MRMPLENDYIPVKYSVVAGHIVTLQEKGEPLTILSKNMSCWTQVSDSSCCDVQ